VKKPLTPRERQLAASLRCLLKMLVDPALTLEHQYPDLKKALRAAPNAEPKEKL